MSDPFARWRNRNGTYDGASMLADVSGLSRLEILWTFDRLKALMAEGKSKDEAKTIVKEEAKARSWEVPA